MAVAVATALARSARMMPLLTSESAGPAFDERQLCLLHRLGLGHAGVLLPQAVEPSHELPDALVGHRPQRGDHALGALLLREGEG